MDQYLHFLATHSKSLANLTQFNTRFEIFKHNLRSIEQHNESDAPFKLAVNKFSDLETHEFLQFVMKGTVKRLGSKTPVGPGQTSDTFGSKNWFSEGFVTKP